MKHRMKRVFLFLTVLTLVFLCIAPEAFAEKKNKSGETRIEQQAEEKEPAAKSTGKKTEKKAGKKAGGAGKTAAAESITISGESTVQKGKSVQLSAQVSPAGASQSVKWKSSNNKIATVNGKGVVKGKKAGTVTITATSADKKAKATFTLSVAGSQTKKITLKAPSKTMSLSQKTMQLTAQATPAEASQTFAWKSSNEKVATVDSNGVVTAVKAGKAKITASATDGSKKNASVQIKVVKTSGSTLDIYWVGNGDNESVRTQVEKAISDYVEPLIGAKVCFHIISWGEWNDKAIGALQGGEKMDLIFTADWEGYGIEARDGLLMPLDKLLNKYGKDIKKNLSKSFLEGAKVDNVLYAIPTNRELVTPQGVIVNKTAAKAIGWDVKEDDPSILSTEDLEKWMKKYKEKYPDKYPYLMDGNSGRWADEPWCTDFAGMAGNAVSMKMAKTKDGKADETVYSIFETEEQEEHIRLMYDWAQKGYIDPNNVGYFDYNSIFGSGDFLFFTQPLLGNNYKAEDMYKSYATADFEVTEITMQPKYAVTSNAGSSMFGIPVTSKDPEAAMKYLNLMHSDEKLVNLMLYGEEGVNYNKVSDREVTLTDQNWYSVHAGPWTVGDTKLQYVLEGEDPERQAKIQKYAKDAKETDSLGFRFVKDNVASEIAAVDMVVAEMALPLMLGQVNPDDRAQGVQALKEALQDAGINEIIAEVQKQYKEWKASK